MMRVCSLLVLAAATSVEVSPVQKVIELLDGLKGKVQADLGAEEKLMDEYTNWCDEEENEKTDTIRSNKRTIGDLQATIQESTSRVSQLSSEIEELAAKISSNEADLKKATSIRDAEHSDFTKTEGELSETIDTLNRANVVLSRGQGSFLQKGSQSLEALTNGLSKIIEATWVNSQQKAVVQSLLQSQTSADADDEDLSLQPQASTAAFTSQGGGILDTLNEMKEKAESTLSESRQTEMKSNHAFEMLKNGLEASIKTDSERKNAASTERSATEQALGEAQQQLASTQNTVKADEAYLADLKQIARLRLLNGRLARRMLPRRSPSSRRQSLSSPRVLQLSCRFMQRFPLRMTPKSAHRFPKSSWIWHARITCTPSPSSLPMPAAIHSERSVVSSNL